jgi:hypothetical protein
MFSGISTNIGQSIQFTWTDANYNTTQQTISTTSLTNGIYLITDASVVSLLGDSLSVQLFGANGVPGQIVQAGTITSDAPYFVDGRPHMKQNLIFLIRAAAINKPFGGTYYDLVIYFNFSDYFPRLNQTSTNFEEFSFLNHQENSSVSSYNWSMSLDNLWPFNANYYLANYFVDTTRTNFATGGTNFNFQINFASSIPAPAILSASPYYTLQPGFLSYFPSSINGEPPIHVTNYNCLQWGVTLQNMQTTASLASGSYNVFQLPYQTGIEVEGMADFFTNVVNFSYGVPLYYQSLSPGGSVTVQEQNYYIGAYASQTPAPILQAVNYFFAPLINPSGDSMGLPGEIDPNYSSNFQPFSMPIDDDFNVTNQTPPLIIGTVGKPMILGGWAKYSIKNGSTTTGKYAYLGQYFVTNAFLLNADGTPTTNSAGIVSPYGEFFPMQAGVAGLVTMQDIDSPYQQGTGVVKIVSMNVDANHDGKLDFSYSGPDQNSASRPFRFWVNDNTDEGDFGGNGIPGQGSQGDGVTQLSLGTVGWMIHGRRDLVDFFPVCLNIGSLFQSNALSAGISATDTNYQFVLSQADSVLRFAYTDLTPTNYMAFLQDTNESWNFAYAPLTTISNGGVALPPSFLSVIATSNQSIILVEAAAPTTQPLVLTIYHGTNQIAQTQLYLSITGVEQMFRSKTMLLNPQPDTVADRLTDASVPNEPDTINKNFVFLHGYNVLPDEARGVAADTFKRMYWSGSHAKFYAVTWEGADTKGSLPFRKLLTPNYHTNVVNAFGTAPFLASFIATLTNSGPVVVAAHSLGNMVVLSAISDWNTPISQYFMLDAAVPIEAIDPTATTNMMIYSTWTGYSNRLFASDWYQLFPTNDARSTLNWNNRLGNLQNVDVYNFYSSGEEVLRTSAGDPPTSVLNKVATQLTYNFWDGFPFGSFTWYWQEKGKGTCSQDWFLGSSHGGWKFNSYWVDSHGNTLSPTIMNGTTNSILQNQPMFNFNSTDNNFLLTVDSELLGAIYGVNPSTYAAANRNRILADAIPAMSLVAGANPVPRLKPQNGDDKNIDMMTLENGWSLGRTVPENNKWHHSDFVQMAYTFTYKLFNQFVTTGNLK